MPDVARLHRYTLPRRLVYFAQCEQHKQQIGEHRLLLLMPDLATNPVLLVLH